MDFSSHHPECNDLAGNGQNMFYTIGFCSNQSVWSNHSVWLNQFVWSLYSVWSIQLHQSIYIVLSNQSI